MTPLVREFLSRTLIDFPNKDTDRLSIETLHFLYKNDQPRGFAFSLDVDESDIESLNKQMIEIDSMYVKSDKEGREIIKSIMIETCEELAMNKRDITREKSLAMFLIMRFLEVTSTIKADEFNGILALVKIN
jgi:hypothetical protein